MRNLNRELLYTLPECRPNIVNYTVQFGVRFPTEAVALIYEKEDSVEDTITAAINSYKE